MAEQLVSIQIASSNRCIVPWSVVIVNHMDTFEGLFQSLKAGKYTIVPPSELLNQATIDAVSVGKDKSSMSLVGKDMNVCDVCRSFGSFVKLHVEQQRPDAPSSNTDTPDAFAILMANQRLLSSPALPDRLQERNKKDKLYNDLISLVDGMGLKWQSGEVKSGKSFLITLTNTLWYIDGHHESLSSRNCEVPQLFRPFVGYNMPELTKHRKRQSTNLSSDALSMHVSSLYYSLLVSWISTKKWEALKASTLSLAKSLDHYLAYLKEQSKKMTLHHYSTSQSVADNTTITVLPTNAFPSPHVKKLNDTILTKNPYEVVHIDEYAPADRKKRYTFIQDLRKGLSKRCVLCTYSVGGPVSNYHFVWILPEKVTLEASLHENQKIIDKIKSDMPRHITTEHYGNT